MKLRPLSRRAVLRGSGVALALPFLEAMLPRRAHAQANTAPKRAVFMFSGNGFPMARWKCNVNPSDSSDFQLSQILSPLAAFKQDCIFIEGAPMRSSFDPQAKGTAHPAGCAAMFTGHYTSPGGLDVGGNTENQGINYAGSASADRVIADAVGGETKFDAYHFAVINTFPAINTRPFYAAPYTPQSAIHDPWTVFDALFGDYGADPTEQSTKLSEQTSVLDAVLEDFKSLRCKVGAADRERLDMHMAHIESIEAKLGIGYGDNPNCGLPELGPKIPVQNQNNIPKLGELQMELLAMALTCDITRVAGLQWISPVNNIVYNWVEGLEDNQQEHHALSHLQTSEAIDKLVLINQWYSEQLAYLIARLKSTPDGDGWLFDNTAILWGSECGDPWIHDRNDVAWTIAGSCGGHFKTGQYVKLAGDDSTPHNRVLLSMAEAMGVTDVTIGAAPYCDNGPLGELRS